MIIATAGHVDHGKTSLVRALTGIDTDQLAEEKRRGLTIELGFAWVGTEAGQALGFVDVPGHERFIATMLAGVAAVDAALLVVAADDGVMPQTREHLSILRLLGVEQLIIVFSRCDLVEPIRLKPVQVELSELLVEQGWASPPIFCVSAVTGEGIPVLREYLFGLTRDHRLGAVGGHTRLLVDRRFSVPGAGCVVTGTLVGGSLEVGQRLLAKGRELRVRSLQIAGRVATRAEAGQRCAVNLAGAVDTHPRRGDWLAAVAFSASERLDVELVQLEGSRWHRGLLQLHLGTAVHPVRVVVLEQGRPVLAQLMLEQPVQAVWGERFIIRDPAANTTLGGGRVLDPQGLRRGRSQSQRLALLREWQQATTVQQALLAALRCQPVELSGFARRFNLTEAELTALLGTVNCEVLRGAEQAWALLPEQMETAWNALFEHLTAWHAAHPEQLGPGEGELRLAICLQLPLELNSCLLGRWLREGRLQRQAWAWYLPGHRQRLLEEDQALLARVSELLLKGGLRPPIIGELSQALAVELEPLRAFLQRMQRAGELIAVAPNRYYLPSQIDGLLAVAKRLAAGSCSGSFTAAEYRDASGIGRNLTIQVLHYLDRAGMTRFVRQQRFLTAG